MKVELSRRAEREMERIARWRREYGSLAVILDEFEHIETTSVLGAVYDAKARRTVHRRLMKKSALATSTSYAGRPELVVIASIWGARRRRGPKFQ